MSGISSDSVTRASEFNSNLYFPKLFQPSLASSSSSSISRVDSATAPVRLETDIEQPTPHETYRLIKTDEDLFEMQVNIGAEWMGLYRFDLQKQLPVDYEVSNWYTSTHPSSQFVTNLMAARADTGCRHTLLDNSYALRFPDAPSEKRTLNSVEEMREILENVFLIALPDSQELDKALERTVHQ